MDLPNNEKLYKINLIQINSSIHNLKIEIEIDYSLLKSMVIENRIIPEKNKLIKLLKRNYFLDYKPPNNVNELSLSKIKPKRIELLKNNFITIKDIVCDFNDKTLKLKKNKLDIFEEKQLLIQILNLILIFLIILF